MLKDGDWVMVVNDKASIERVIGYIKEIDDVEKKAYFIAVRHDDKRRFGGEEWIKLINLKPLENRVSVQDWQIMMDWALDERDEVTFNELVKYQPFVNNIGDKSNKTNI